MPLMAAHAMHQLTAEAGATVLSDAVTQLTLDDRPTAGGGSRPATDHAFSSGAEPSDGREGTHPSSEEQDNIKEDVMPEGPRYEGVVKFFNSQKGYGFVVPVSGGPDGMLALNVVFVHHTAIQNNGGFKSLAEGEEVEYSLYDGPKGHLGLYVTGRGGVPVKGDPLQSGSRGAKAAAKLAQNGRSASRGGSASVTPDGSLDTADSPSTEENTPPSTSAPSPHQLAARERRQDSARRQSVPSDKNGRQGDRDRGRPDRYGRRASTPVSANGRTAGMGPAGPMYVYAPQAVGVYYPPSSGPYYPQVSQAPYQAHWVDGHGVPMQMPMYGGMGGMAPPRGYYLATPSAAATTGAGPLTRVPNAALTHPVPVTLDNSYAARNFGVSDDVAQAAGGAGFTYTANYGGYGAQSLVYPEAAESIATLTTDTIVLPQGAVPFGYNSAAAS